MQCCRLFSLIVLWWVVLRPLVAGSAWEEGSVVVFLGDSITRNGAVPPAGFIRVVEREFAEKGIPLKVIPAGIGGQKSLQMLARLETDVLARKPDWLVLSCGVNDVWHGANGTSLEDYRRNMTEIVTRAQAAGVKVLILTATLIGEDSGNANNLRLDSYNEFLRQLAREKGCLLADPNNAMRRALAKESGRDEKGLLLTTDGVHLNEAGNRLVADEILVTLGFSQPGGDGGGPGKSR